MTKLHLVENFQDLADKKTILQTHLFQACTLKDLVFLINNINLELKNLDRNDCNYFDLIKIRQRAYEKKNKIKKDKQIEVEGGSEKRRDSLQVESAQESIKHNFKKLERVQFTPRYCCLVLLIIFFSCLLGIQSFYIYKAIGMEMALLVSIGSILMTIGVGLFIQTKVRIMNVLIIFYETFLLLSGTFLQEQVLQHEKLNNEQHYGFLQEEYKKLKKDFDLLNFRYENKESKVYQNSWYKTQILDPAWAKVNASIQLLKIKEQGVIHGTSFYIIVMLKILFRVGVVCLLMLLLHELKRLICHEHSKEKSNVH